MSLDEHARALAASLAKAGLVPGPAEAVIPGSPVTPTTRLRVSFSSSSSGNSGEEKGQKAVELGTFFRAGECGRAPRVSFSAEAATAAAAEDDGSYLFLMTDPDAPTPDDPKFAFWRHWVVGGLRPGRDDDNVVSGGRVLTEYLGPGPKDEYVSSSPVYVPVFPMSKRDKLKKRWPNFSWMVFPSFFDRYRRMSECAG